MLSGAIAGLAGGIELTGTADRLTETISNGFGFAGIIVAALALMRPSGVAVVALLFRSSTNWRTKYPNTGRFLFCFHNLASLLFCLALLEPGVLSRYRIVLDANTRSIKKEMSDD